MFRVEVRGEDQGALLFGRQWAVPFAAILHVEADERVVNILRQPRHGVDRPFDRVFWLFAKACSAVEFEFQAVRHRSRIDRRFGDRCSEADERSAMIPLGVEDIAHLDAAKRLLSGGQRRLAPDFS